MKHTHTLVLTSLFLIATAQNACTDGDTSEGEGEGDAAGEGEGDVAGEGEGDVAGEGEGDVAGEGEGEGEGVLVGELYTGVSEEGVVCGETTCNVGLSCCPAFMGGAAPTCAPEPGECPGAMVVNVACDGPEDCTDAASPICCGGMQFGGTACVDAATCTGPTVALCVDSEDCNAGVDCCSGGQLAALGVEAGICTPAAPNGDRCTPLMP
jgi:hypothetical protein